MVKRAKSTSDMEANNALEVKQAENETGAQAVARKVLEPGLRHALSASAFAGKVLGKLEKPGIADFIGHVQSETAKAVAGDLAIASKLLAAQAITLDAMFTDLAGRASLNMGEYISAADRYARLALKAQNNCRATLEALAKLHQPRVQTVRHVHVNEGGQAIVADEFHNHMGGQGNAKSVNQSDATGPAGQCSALSSPDANGNRVPVTGSYR